MPAVTDDEGQDKWQNIPYKYKYFKDTLNNVLQLNKVYVKQQAEVNLER